MREKSLSENSNSPKAPKAELAIRVFIAIAFLPLLFFTPKCKYPLNIILITVMAVLVAIQLILTRKSSQKHKMIEKSNTILEWTVLRKDWHITDACRFSPLALSLLFALNFVSLFSVLAIAMKLLPPDHNDKDALTFAKLTALSAGLGAFSVALYASLWWWAKFKVKLTTVGIKRTFNNSSRIWKYERIKSYHFETLRSEPDVFNVVVLLNHKGKIWKIALDDSVDKAKIEEILNKHGIPKLEQAT
jgi:hypothetical protein